MVEAPMFSGRDGFSAHGPDRQNSLPYLDPVKETFRYLPPDRFKEIIDGVSVSLKDDEGRKRARVLHALFKKPKYASIHTGMEAFTSALKDTNVTTDEVAHLLDHPNLHPMYSTMITDKNPQLGVVFSYLSVDQMPDAIKEQLSFPRLRTDLRPTTDNTNWLLCNSSEHRLKSAFRLGAVTALQEDGTDYMVAKFKGKSTALCVQSFVSKNGYAFFQGNWYSPRDLDSRTALRDSFDNDEARMQIPQGEWTFMRKAHITNSTRETFIQDAVNQARLLPDRYPDAYIQIGDDYKTRKEYRQVQSLTL